MKIPGTGISNFFTAEFSHFLMTICFTGVLIGGAIRENPGYQDFKYRYWKKNPGYRDFKIPVLEKNPGCRDFKILVLEKNPGYWYLKSSTENRVESLYNRENFPGASRPSKTLSGVLRDPQNRLSLGGGTLLYGKGRKKPMVKSMLPMARVEKEQWSNQCCLWQGWKKTNG